MNIKFTPMDRDNAAEIVRWHYEPPYDIYDLDDSEESIQYALDPDNCLYAMQDIDDELVGFCSFGRDAQVPGGDYNRAALDIGMGIRPDLTGQGLGAKFVASVLAFARDEFSPTYARVTIAGFNQRAQRVWGANGFQYKQTFIHKKTKREFVVLVRMM